jgi:Mannosyltransferase (PIG-V)
MERDRSGAIAWRPVAGMPALRVGAEFAAALRLAWRATWTTRLLVWAAGVGALLVWGTSGREAGFDPAGLTAPFGAFGDLLAGPAARWDSSWYLGISISGYGGDPSRAAFFPLYPLLARGGGWIVGSPLVAGALISCACLVVALAALHELTRLELGEGAARWTVLALALSPMSFFFSAVYSESLFLALSVGALLAARRERWWWAGVLGGLAAATRSAGVVLLVPLALLAWRQGPRRSAALALALVPLGLGAYLGGLALAGHDAFSPFHVQEVWFRAWAGPFGGVRDGAVAAWEGVRQLWAGRDGVVYFAKAGGDPIVAARMNVLLFGFLIAGIVALVGAARRLPLAYTAYAVAALALPLSYPVGPQPLMSLPRFELVLIPLWMWWGAWLYAHPRWRAPALTVSAAGLALFTGIFATWHFIA